MLSYLPNVNKYTEMSWSFLREYYTVFDYKSSTLDGGEYNIKMLAFKNAIKEGDANALWEANKGLIDFIRENIDLIYSGADCNGKVTIVSMNRMVALKMLQTNTDITNFLVAELFFYDKLVAMCANPVCGEDENSDRKLDFYAKKAKKISSLFETRKEMLSIAKKVYQKANYRDWELLTQASIDALDELKRRFEEGDDRLGRYMIELDKKYDSPVVNHINDKLLECGSFYTTAWYNKIDMLVFSYNYDVKRIDIEVE